MNVFDPISRVTEQWLALRRLLFVGTSVLFFSVGFAADSEFLRFVETGPQTGHVDTALTTYRAPNGAEVALISALHVGDAEYYKVLNERFKEYDSVLYEMVKDTRPRSQQVRRSGHFVSQMQIGMKSMLGLEFQLDLVDYTAANFVHADMDARTFSRLQKEKGENFFTLMLQSVLQEQQMRLSGTTQPLSAFDLIRAFSSGDSTHALKWLFAQQLDQMEVMMLGMDQGMDGKGSVIVTERNRVAMNVLRDELKKKKRRIGIFYGAGHMPDLEKRLGRLGFRKVREEWILAWDLEP